jgi:hypothetical protein
VKSSARSIFAALLALSLAAKLAANGPDYEVDSDPVTAAAAAVLDRAGFGVRPQHRPSGTMLFASKGDCRLLLGDYTPYGTFAELYALHAAPIGPLRFLYRAEVYAQAPKFAPLTEFYLWREAHRIGITYARAPIIAVAASRACDAGALPLAQLASIRA